MHDDIRLVNDATVEKDEVRPEVLLLPWGNSASLCLTCVCRPLQSHAGKVVLRSWYEKNKHIFPASRWEPYDPEKKWDKYTVRRLGQLGRLWSSAHVSVLCLSDPVKRPLPQPPGPAPSPRPRPQPLV